MNKVCPDRQMLSLYFDGELPSPWKEKLEDHVSACPECAEQMETYKCFSLASSAGGGAVAGDEAVVNEAGERVWKRLDASMKHGRMFPRRRAIWRRSVSLPIPAAAALLIVGLILAWVMVPTVDEMASMTLASETEFEVPAQNMESVIEYLTSRSGSEMIILHLPESQSFVSNGEPTIIRAADYSRQVASWNIQGRRRH